MTKSELIKRLAKKQHAVSTKSIESGVNSIVEQIVEAIVEHRRVEVRGFGSFSIRYRSACKVHNPKTKKHVSIAERHIPYFKPGKQLREMVNTNRKRYPIIFA